MIRKLLLLLLLQPFVLRAQVNPGPRITALGSSGVALQDAWSLQANQAGIASQVHPTISAAYENDYFNPDLTRQSALFVYPAKNNAFGLSFQNYGFSAYTEQRAGFAYARNFANTVFAAIGFNYHQIRIPKYGNAETWSVEAGLQYAVNDNLLIGAHIANPNRSSYNAAVNAVIPVSIEFGASYRFTGNVLLNSGIVKTLNSTTDVCAGLEYGLAGWFNLRGGISANPFRQYAGFGFDFHGFHMDAAASSHPVLGYSPQVALSYEF